MKNNIIILLFPQPMENFEGFMNAINSGNIQIDVISGRGIFDAISNIDRNSDKHNTWALDININNFETKEKNIQINKFLNLIQLFRKDDVVYTGDIVYQWFLQCNKYNLNPYKKDSIYKLVEKEYTIRIKNISIISNKCNSLICREIHFNTINKLLKKSRKWNVKSIKESDDDVKYNFTDVLVKSNKNYINIRVCSNIHNMIFNVDCLLFKDNQIDMLGIELNESLYGINNSINDVLDSKINEIKEMFIDEIKSTISNKKIKYINNLCSHINQVYIDEFTHKLKLGYSTENFTSIDTLNNNLAIMDETKQCIICHESDNEKKLYTQLTCLHTFHTDCIFEWFSVQFEKNSESYFSCPNCREKILLK